MNNNFSINQVTLLGNLCKDPQQSSDKAPVRLSVSTRNSWRNKEGELKGYTTYHDYIDIWADQVRKYVMENLHQGDTIFLQGELAKESYEDKNGDKRIKYFIRAKEVRLVEHNANLDSTTDSNPSPTSSVTPPQTQKQSESAAVAEEDDVPFVGSDVAFDPNYQTLSVLKGVAPNTLTGVWE